MQRRRRSMCIAISLSVLLLANTLSCDRPNERIRIALNPWPGYALFFLAEELNYFEHEGIEIQLVELMSLSDVRKAFEERHVEIMACSLVEAALSSISTDLKPHIVHVCDRSDGADMLLSQTGITSLAELKGRRVAYEPLTVDVLMIYAAMKSANLSPSDVQLVPMPQMEASSAFARGELDAIECYPPFSSELQRSHNTNCLFDSRRSDVPILDILVASDEIVQHHSESLRKILRAYERAARFYGDHPEEGIRIMAARTGMTPDEFKASLSEVKMILDSPTRGGELKRDLVQALNVTQDALKATTNLGHQVPSETVTKSLLQSFPLPLNP